MPSFLFKVDKNTAVMTSITTMVKLGVCLLLLLAFVTHTLDAATAAPCAATAAPGAATAAPCAATPAPGAATPAPGAVTAAPGAATPAPGGGKNTAAGFTSSGFTMSLTASVMALIYQLL